MPLKNLLRRADAFDERAARRAREKLERLHAKLTQQLVNSVGIKWDLQEYEQARREITQMLVELEREFSADLADVIKLANKIGNNLADNILKGLIVKPGFTPRLAFSFSFINDALQARSTLIKGITDNIRAKIDIEIDQGIQGVKAGIQVIKAIADVKDFTGIAFKTAEQRAEDIFRTEASRIINMSTIERYREYNEQAEEKTLLKYWLAASDSRTRPTHLQIAHETDPALGGTPIPFNNDFILSDGERAFGPQTPTLSAENVINCRCRLVAISKADWLKMKGEK